MLYVDDEPDNLRIFELTFRRDFKILTAASAEQGPKILNDNPIAVVLSDQRMPGMTGVDFLAPNFKTQASGWNSLASPRPRLCSASGRNCSKSC